MRSVARRTRHTLVVVTLALAGCRAPLQSPTSTPDLIPLYFVTDSGTAPFLQDLANTYQQDNDLVAIVNERETGTSIETQLNQVTPPFIITTIAPPEDNDLWAAPLAYEAIAIISHPNVSIPRLTAQDLRDVFSGNASTWQAIGGTSIDQQIVIVTREEGAAIRTNFQRLVMGQRPISAGARLATTPTTMIEIVATTPGAIGYVELSQLTDDVTPIPIAEFSTSMAISVSRDTVANGSYPLQTPVLVIGANAPTNNDGYFEFIIWAQQGEGRSIVSRYYVPIALNIPG